MNQYLVDYTVRNIPTGDEDDLRLLELTDDEIAGFPDAVRGAVRSLLASPAAAYRTGSSLTGWDATAEAIRTLLLPYISDSWLYQNDYGAWEQNVLDEAYGTGIPVTEPCPPEAVGDRVRQVLDEQVAGALENWSEGHWEDWSTATKRREVLERFVGYLESIIELSREDVSDLDQPIMQGALSA